VVDETPGIGPDPEEATGRYAGPRAVDPPGGPDPHDDPAFITRTRFLTNIAVVTGGVMTAAILVPVVGFAVAPTLGGEDFQWVDIGALSTFPLMEVTSLAVSGPDPEADRRVFLRMREKKGVRERLVQEGALEDVTGNLTLEMLQPADLEMVAMWNRCAHLGCPVNYAAGGDNYSCPCHGGAYDSRGRVTAGPPPRPLDRFDAKIVGPDGNDLVKVDGTGVISLEPVLRKSGSGPVEYTTPDARVLVGKPFSIDDDENVYELHGPGEPVEGILSNLYPL